MTRLADCPRYKRCSAPICPLDGDWRVRRHLSGEPICAYLRETARHGARPPESISGAEIVGPPIAALYPTIVARVAPIRYELARSARRGPRLGRWPGAFAVLAP